LYMARKSSSVLMPPDAFTWMYSGVFCLISSHLPLWLRLYRSLGCFHKINSDIAADFAAG
jgi:hypothetical protein